MGGVTFLQIFLLINVFIIGVFSAIGVRHAWAHFHPQQNKPVKPVVQPTHLPPEVKEQMLAKAEADFKAVLEKATSELKEDLEGTTEGLNKELSKLGDDVVKSETERYHTMLETLRTQAETVITTSQAEITDHQTDIKTKLDENITAEKQRLVAQIDTKLGDAVMSFLTESLQHNIDLGAQIPYMLANLEEHKAELIKGVSDEE